MHICLFLTRSGKTATNTLKSRYWGHVPLSQRDRRPWSEYGFA